jgi:hypothetical protein
VLQLLLAPLKGPGSVGDSRDPGCISVSRNTCNICHVIGESTKSHALTFSAEVFIVLDVEGTISSNDNWNGTDESNASKIIITYIQIY